MDRGWCRAVRRGVALVALIMPASLALGDIIVEGRVVETKADGPCVDLLTAGPQRFVDCGNGTVYDLHTNLIWLKEASCNSFGVLGDGRAMWLEAQAEVAMLAHGHDCDGDGAADLEDNSQPGDWRLPREDEWFATIKSAISLGCTTAATDPPLTDDAGTACLTGGAGSSFMDVHTSWYFTADSDEVNPAEVVRVALTDGTFESFGKTNFSDYIWPVRQGGSYGQQGAILVDGAVAEAAAGEPCEGLLTTGSQRYADCADGTVLDAAHDLLWLKDASCVDLAGVAVNGKSIWATAMVAAAALADGVCGLNDGSQPGDWRLPTRGEWADAIFHAADMGCTDGGAKSPPSLTNTAGNDCLVAGVNPFIGLDALDNIYWSSTSSDIGPVGALGATLQFGSAGSNYSKAGNLLLVWPVRERRWASPR